MSTYIIQIAPKKQQFDPLASSVKGSLVELGEPPKSASAVTERLYKISGKLTPQDAEKIAETLLVDPVIEKFSIEGTEKKKGKAAKGKGFLIDIWPKAGVTDSVGETVEKGIRDLGFSGEVLASSGQRYFFPRVTSAGILENLARKVLGNELIHNINIRKVG